MTNGVEDFEQQRSRLFSIAHRMLGSVAEAEDIVQEAYLRWREAPEGGVRSPRFCREALPLATDPTTILAGMAEVLLSRPGGPTAMKASRTP